MCPPWCHCYNPAVWTTTPRRPSPRRVARHRTTTTRDRRKKIRETAKFVEKGQLPISRRGTQSLRGLFLQSSAETEVECCSHVGGASNIRSNPASAFVGASLRTSVANQCPPAPPSSHVISHKLHSISAVINRRRCNNRTISQPSSHPGSQSVPTPRGRGARTVGRDRGTWAQGLMGSTSPSLLLLVIQSGFIRRDGKRDSAELQSMLFSVIVFVPVPTKVLLALQSGAD